MVQHSHGLVMAGCPLCSASRDEIVWQGEHCRVVHVADPDYPGYYRVIWNAHVAEMSDLSQQEQGLLMGAVFATEHALRASMNPDKINLASFGNVVPHLHWHVIARYADDRHFPEPVWGREQRRGRAHAAPDHATLAKGIIAHGGASSSMLFRSTSGMTGVDGNMDD
jgi:diadenosine tetraphosphate (Ap4A) HIT family hydrolase